MEQESGYYHLSHNVSNLVYRFVCPAKYRRVVIDESAFGKHVWGIELRYVWISFLEIGTDKDHVHFFDTVSAKQESPRNHTSSQKHKCKESVCRTSWGKEEIVGGEFWSDVYFATSVGKNINEAVIQKYVKQQGTQDEYKQLYMKV